MKLLMSSSIRFTHSIHTLVKDASEEDLKKFLQAEDDMIELEDKLAVIAEFADTHDDIDGVAIIGFGRK